MSVWYDRQGKPVFGTGAKVGSKTWHKGMREVEKLLTDRKYKIVKQEYTPNKIKNSGFRLCGWAWIMLLRYREKSTSP